MIYKGDLRFNCCESVLLLIDRKHPLPGLSSSVIRIASNFGGGIAGWGDMCGAVTGVAMAIGLINGTEGNENVLVYDEKRAKERALTQEFIESFRSQWGYITCRGLLGCEGCSSEERKKRYDELNAKNETHCDEYVDWSAQKALDLLKKTE
jgi:C_GCAxxG_C_C family probable redox protein